MIRAIRGFIDLVKFEHTVFALPFAYTGCLMAAGGAPEARTVGWILCAMVGARTAGMALNRIIDREIDARNPRTKDRTLPAGRMSTPAAVAIAMAALALLVLASWHLNPLALALSPVAVALLVAYSFLKRFTWLAHAGLGMVLACAPIGGWIAVRGTVDAAPLILGGAVLLWCAGFDVLYACLDVDFDRREGLHSIPQRFGIPAALHLARGLHGATVLLLAACGFAVGMGSWYFAGVGVVTALLMHEHRLVSPDDLSRMDAAFFTMNGWVSVTLLAFTWLDFLLGGHAW